MWKSEVSEVVLKELLRGECGSIVLLRRSAMRLDVMTGRYGILLKLAV